MGELESWGRYPTVQQTSKELVWVSDPVDFSISGSVLPYGVGRSYGDCCLNDGGTVLVTRRLDRFISFDKSRGVLRCESGVTLAAILKLIVPEGWFLPASPGTQFVTVGGAIANDIHGKNHHKAGTFGRYVLQFELLRSDGERLICSPQQNQELFKATISGLGLTGLILWVEFQLKKIETQWISEESIKFGSLDEFFEISADSSHRFEYTVAWLDCLSAGSAFGRGIFMRGNHALKSECAAADPKRGVGGLLSVPFDLPNFVLNRHSIRIFNALYYNKQLNKERRFINHYQPFFYPLDAIGHWNRIYGKRGFFQFQCVVPSEPGQPKLKALLKEIVDSGEGSFLAVLKEFGSIESPGMMSFPRPGVTLALDFANNGDKTLALLTRLDNAVAEGGGCVYPAKDATMSGRNFKQYFPRWQEFSRHIDPKFSSTFWRRVMEEGR